MNTVIVIEKLTKDFELLKNQFERSFSPLHLNDDFEKADAIFIKPNLTYPIYKKGVTTRKVFVECLVAALRRHGIL